MTSNQLGDAPSAGSTTAPSTAVTLRLPAVDAILALLENNGVDCIYGVPGGPLTALFESIQRRSSIRFVLARHEAGAAFMAASHALVTGKLAVACGTSGPGATNALTGIAMAKTNCLPVLFLSGQVSTSSFGTGAIQESSVFATDLVGIFAPVTKLSAQIPAPERVVSTIELAIRTATSGRKGPVHLNLPANYLTTTIEVEAARLAEPILDSTKVVAPSAVPYLERELHEAKRPVFLVGHGVRCSGAGDEILALAYAVGARIVTTPKGKGTIAETEPCFAGIVGFGGHDSATATLADADCLIVFGSSLDEFVLQGQPLGTREGCPILQVDIDPTAIGRGQRVTKGFVADVRTLARELLAILGHREAPLLESGRVRVMYGGAFPEREPDTSSRKAQAVSPRSVIETLNATMSPDDLLYVDIGTTTLWAIHHFEVRRPGTFFTDLGFGCMGTAVAGAVGAALANPGRRTVALVGDGAFAMHGFEVHAAVDLGLPITWIVVNNQGHGMVYQGDQLMKGRDLGVSRFRQSIDIASVAYGLRAASFSVYDSAELEMSFRAALTSEGPSVVDIEVALDEVPPTLQKRVEGLAAYMGRTPNFKTRAG